VTILLGTLALCGGAAVCAYVIKKDASFVVLAVVFVGATLTGSGQVGAGHRSLVPADVLAAAVAALLIFRFVFVGARGPRLGDLSILPAWPALVAVCGLLLLPASTDIPASLGEIGAYAVLGGYCMLGIAAANTDVNLRFDRVLLAAFAVQLVLCVRQLASGVRLAGGFGLANQFAAFLILLVPVALHYGVREQRRVWLGVLVLLVPLILGAGSRTALVTAAIIGTIYLVTTARKTERTRARRPVGPLILVAVCVLPVAFVAAKQTLPRWTFGNRISLFAREEQRGTQPLAFHKSNFEQGYHAFKNRPVTGSALSPRISQYAAETYEVHDNFVGLLAQLGVFGVIFVALLLVGVWRLWRGARGDDEMRALVLGIAGVVIGMGFFHYTLRQRFVWVAIGYAAVTIIQRRTARNAQLEEESPKLLVTSPGG
jgi:O-antigen ligase